MSDFLRIYCYDQNTGEYTNIHDAQPSPLEAPGTYLFPTTFFTQVEPLVTGQYEKAVWNGSAWFIVKDYRGVTLYNKITGDTDLTIDTIGNDIPVTHTLVKKERFESYIVWSEEQNNWIEDPVKKLEYNKGQKKLEILYAFEAELSQGKYTSTALGIDVDYRRIGVKNDMQNIIGLISYMQRNNLETLPFKGYSETTTATIAQLQAVIVEMEDRGVMLYGKKHQLEDAVDPCTTEEQLNSIVW